MSETPQMVASAVIVPAGTGVSQPPTSHDRPSKRRQSSSSSQSSKRPRLDPIVSSLNQNGKDVHPAASPETPNQVSPAPHAQTGRRKSGPDQERGRNKRLFGALMGTLSQSSRPGFGGKRAEVEKKQQAKLREQAAERDEIKKRELAKLNRVRQSQQKRVDDQGLRLKHSNNIAMARFLQTRTDPVLYYKPYDLLPEQEDRIRRQIEDVETDTQDDLRRLQRSQELDPGHMPVTDAKQERRPSDDGPSMVSQAATNGDTNELPSDVIHTVPSVEQAGNKQGGNPGGPRQDESADLQDDGDENEDMVVEPGEDSVIY